MLTHIGLCLVVIGILFPLIATACVALRLWTRHIKRTYYGADDWLIVLSLIFACVVNFSAVYGVYNAGYGDPLDKLTPSKSVDFKKVLFTFTFSWTLATGTIKTSIVLLYRRIFTTRAFGNAMIVLMSCVMGWMIANAFVVIFSWTPVSGFWTRHGNPNIDYPVFLIVTGVLTLILDFVTLASPIFVIRKLNMDRTKKVAVSGIFLLGAICVVASLVRVPYSIWYMQSIGTRPGGEHTNRISTLVPTISLWAMIEVDIGIIAACLPTYPTLLQDRSVDSIIRSARSMISRSTLSSRKSSDSENDKSEHEKQSGPMGLSNGRSYCATAGRNGSVDNKTLVGDPDVIHKHQQVEIVRLEQV